MKYFWSYFTVLVLFVVQTTLGKYIDVFSVMPNLVFVFAVCYSMFNFPVRSAVLCAVAGLLMDIYSCRIIGTNALMYMYIGLLVSLFGSSLMKKSIWAVALGVIIVSAVYQSVYFVVRYMLGGSGGFLYALVRIILPGAVYDGAAALAVSVWAHWLSEEHIRGF